MKKKYSIEFQYLLMKKFIDGNWTEGSSVLSALKVGKKYGFLPTELFKDLNGNPYPGEQDRYLPYSQYIAKLKAIPDSEVQRLIGLCENPIAGYAQVQLDSQSIAKAIVDAQAGVLCRYGCQKLWWTPSWLEKDISPLRYAPETSGHAIGMTNFNYTTKLLQTLCNTWGKTYCRNGSIDIIFNEYLPTEVWTILQSNPMFQFKNDLKLGSRLSPDVKELQKRLGMPQLLWTGFYGTITKGYVQKYQTAHGLTVDGVVGPLTRASLN